MKFVSDPAPPVHQPFDIDAEQGLLGLLIRNSDLVPQVAGFLEAEHFYDPLHARIFAQIMDWSMSGEMPVTALTLAATLKSDPGVASLEGGQAYFQALRDAAPVSDGPATLGRIVRDLSLRRDALAAMADATDALVQGPAQVRSALRDVIAVADEAERIATAARFQTTADAADESIRDAERASAGQPVRAVKTGLRKLDDETGGLQGADFVVIAGKSGMGKSALMGGISWRAAAAHFPVIVFSLEMKRKQWTQRLLTDMDMAENETAVAYRKFRASGIDANGKSLGFTHEDFARMMFARDRLRDFSPWLEIHDEDGLTIAQIAARARAFQAKWRTDPAIRAAQRCLPDEDPIGLVIVDYIQIVDPASRQFRPREQEVAGMARGLKGLSKKLNWPVMAGSQLNEDDKGRASKRPQAGDVRESKAIYHEADIMLAPYRMAEVLEQSRPDAAPGEPAWNAWNAEKVAAKNHFDLIGMKNRMGRRFTLSLWGDMAASAVRDEAPIPRRTQQAADDLLADLKG